jgi:Protein of unknown function (DUF3667)
MFDAMSDAATTHATCPFCDAPASGRFCSACGKELALHGTSAAVLRDTFGLKAPPARVLGRTAWMTIAQPAELTRRWIEGRRQGLATPIAMMSTVTAVTAILGFILLRVSGAEAPAEQKVNFGDLLMVAPFLKSSFPHASAYAVGNNDAMLAQFKATGSYLAAFWPALFILPGYLALAPWRRLNSHDALILACVESVFLLIVTGVWSCLKLVAPGVADSGLTSLLFWIVICAHGAMHVRQVANTGWGYAISRPFIAAVIFPIVGYFFVVLIMALTLMFANT